MKVQVAKTTEGSYPVQLIPVDDTDRERCLQMEDGEIFEIEYKKDRNPKNHRRFFVLLKLGFDNQRDDRKITSSMEGYRKWLLIMAGYYDIVVVKDQELVVPRSMAFANMDEVEFREMYSACVDVIAGDIDLSRQEVLDELVRLL